MNKTIKIKIKYLLLILIAAFFLFSQFWKTDLPEDKVVIKKTTSIDYVEKIDSAKVDVSEKKPVKKIDYLLDTLTNKARKKPLKKHSDTSYKEKNEIQIKANVYQDTIQTTNGKAVIKTISTGRVLGLDLTFFTKDKIVTHNQYKEVTKYAVPNAWFLNIEPKLTLLPAPSIVGIETSVDYTINNKFRIGAGVEYNTLMPSQQKIIFNFKIGIAL